MDNLGWMEIVSNLSFGGLLVYLIVVHLPKEREIHRQERQEWLALVRKRDDEYHADHLATVKSIVELAQSIRDLLHERRDQSDHISK